MYEYNATIVRVIDGDTVDCDIDLGFTVWRRNERVRLYGIDTGETRTRDKREKEYGLLAKKRVMELLIEGETFRLKTHGFGKYGRPLGTFFVVQLSRNKDTCLIENVPMSVNQILLDEYLAIPYDGTGSKEERRALHENNMEYHGI